MGAFGSCLGVGRPAKLGPGSRQYNSNLMSVETDPFATSATPRRPAQLMNRSQPVGPRTYLLNSTPPNGQLPKLPRQSSSLSNGHHQQQSSSAVASHQLQLANGGQKLVELDDNPASSNNSHLNNCNINNFNNNNRSSHKTQQQQQQITFTSAQKFEDEFRLHPDEIKLLIALYDYEALASTEDLRFYKGEHLESAARYMKESDWFLARSKTTKKVGWVPSNYVAELKSLGAEPWYLGKIGRVEAEERLRYHENRDGAFIIRDSDTEPNNYSLSILHNENIKHYRIKQYESGGYYIHIKTVFSTIHDLVLHYSNAPDGLCINLIKPCISPPHKPMPYGLSHETQDKWEIDRSELTLGVELGRGQFGQVHEGWFRKTTRVAIKQLRKGSMDPKDFLAEAQIMKRMRHKHLVHLFAVCTREEPVYIVTELMSKGALISYLQTPEGKNLSLQVYIKMATQIADGMSYLEREKYVHRDLAARNILVGDNIECKIADFGLARFISETEYEARAGAKFPIKWTAPEAANFSKFTIKSDVWSFGIVLYEIITKGGTPYPDMSNQDVLDQIEKGYRMKQPPNCEDKYYTIMKECWRKDPQTRPTFEHLLHRLSEYFMSDEQYREASSFRIN